MVQSSVTPRLRDSPAFWVILLVFCITTLGLAILVSTGRPLWAALTVVGHIELVLIGQHLVRTRARA